MQPPINLVDLRLLLAGKLVTVLVEVFVNQELVSSAYYVLGTPPIDVH